MTRHQLGAIIARTFALFFIFKAAEAVIAWLPAAYMKMTAPAMSTASSAIVQQSQSAMEAKTMVIAGAYIVLALLFWFAAKVIGRALAGKDADAPVSLGAAQDYAALVFAAAGCFVLTLAVPEASQLLGYSISEPGQYRVMPFQLVQKGMSIGLYVAIAALFIVGGRWLGRFVVRGKSV